MEKPMKFRVFDTIKLTEAMPLSDGGFAAIGSVGTLVESLQGGEAYLVELFGSWVKYDADENLVPASGEESEAFTETIGVEMVYPHQMQLVKSASETVGIRAQLLSLIEEMPEPLLQEVVDFAEFLRQKAA
jgi:hypothetical protein